MTTFQRHPQLDAYLQHVKASTLDSQALQQLLQQQHERTIAQTQSRAKHVNLHLQQEYDGLLTREYILAFRALPPRLAAEGRQSFSLSNHASAKQPDIEAEQEQLAPHTTRPQTPVIDLTDPYYYSHPLSVYAHAIKHESRQQEIEQSAAAHAERLLVIRQQIRHWRAEKEKLQQRQQSREYDRMCDEFERQQSLRPESAHSRPSTAGHSRRSSTMSLMSHRRRGSIVKSAVQQQVAELDARLQQAMHKLRADNG